MTLHASRLTLHASRFTLHASRFTRAFTIIELLVVMLVMVVAAAAVTPSFLSFRRRSLVQTAARRTLALAGEARSLAVMRDATVTLTYDRGAHVMWLVAEPPIRDHDPETPSGPEPLNERPLPDTRLIEYPFEVEVEVSGGQAAGSRSFRLTDQGEGVFGVTDAGAPSIRFSGDGHADAGVIRFETEGVEPVVLQVNPRTGRLRIVEEAP